MGVVRHRHLWPLFSVVLLLFPLSSASYTLRLSPELGMRWGVDYDRGVADIQVTYQPREEERGVWGDAANGTLHKRSDRRRVGEEWFGAGRDCQLRCP